MCWTLCRFGFWVGAATGPSKALQTETQSGPSAQTGVVAAAAGHDRDLPRAPALYMLDPQGHLQPAPAVSLSSLLPMCASVLQ